jgi:hypothetical protein
LFFRDDVPLTAEPKPPVSIHECHGTEKRTEKNGGYMKEWTLCEVCNNWWLSFMGNLRALEKLDFDNLPPPPKDAT